MCNLPSWWFFVVVRKIDLNDEIMPRWVADRKRSKTLGDQAQKTLTLVDVFPKHLDVFVSVLAALLVQEAHSVHELMQHLASVFTATPDRNLLFPRAATNL